MDDLTILRTQSLPGVLERELEKVILGGVIAPGERVNENALAARFGVSRGPLREALRSLMSSGLIDQVPNRGFFVRKLELEQALAIYDVRAALFGLAGELLAQHADPETIARLRGFLDDMDAAAAAMDFDAYYPLNLAFHTFIVGATDNPVLAASYGDLVKKLHLFRARSLVQGGGLSVSNAEHRDMVEAVAARDPVRAREAFNAHVARAKARLIAAAQAKPARQINSRTANSRTAKTAKSKTAK
ncbi:MAG: Regulatory protein GntR, HTH:GntR, C-terminal [Hyphomicrobiales bacterium]|nr:Regulatory protein GntR, HTH:GntR, C-terminal [Hyphomicrobiales bacterium]